MIKVLTGTTDEFIVPFIKLTNSVLISSGFGTFKFTSAGGIDFIGNNPSVSASNKSNGAHIRICPIDKEFNLVRPPLYTSVDANVFEANDIKQVARALLKMEAHILDTIIYRESKQDEVNKLYDALTKNFNLTETARSSWYVETEAENGLKYTINNESNEADGFKLVIYPVEPFKLGLLKNDNSITKTGAFSLDELTNDFELLHEQSSIQANKNIGPKSTGECIQSRDMKHQMRMKS